MTSEFSIEPMRDQIIDEDLIDSCVLVLKTLSDPARLQILWSLSIADRTLSELAQLVGVTPNSVSQILAKLRHAKVLNTRKNGSHTIYSLTDERAKLFIQQALDFAEYRMQLDVQA